jgi:hypothetical protein
MVTEQFQILNESRIYLPASQAIAAQILNAVKKVDEALKERVKIIPADPI